MRMFLVLYIGLWCMISTAENYYVDNVAGKDSFDGKSNTVRDNTGPFATIARALKAAGAGDTVHLNPTGRLYREGVDFNKHKGGEPGRPLVFDGHGATVSGAIPCPENGWKVWKGGVLQRDDMRSWGFLLVDGEMVFELQTIDSLQPGEFCTLPQMPIHFFPPKEKKLDELLIEVDQPDGTTLKLESSKWQRSNSKIQQVLRYPGLNKVTRMKIDGNPAPMLSAKERLQPGQWCGEGKCMYYYPPAGKSVESLSIECAVVTNALSLNGETAWVTVQNLNVRHPNDDGYNLHGHVTHVEFINCNAFQCGDQGFSAHDQCESVVDGAVYEQCSQGVANVNGGGFSITRNAIIRNCRGPAFLIQGAARHELTDSILIDNPGQVAIEGASQFKADNVLMVNTSSSKLLGGTGISVNCKTSLSRITSAGLGCVFRAGEKAEVLMENCLFAPGQTIHIRADDPFAILKMKNITAGKDNKIEWGKQYPWKNMPLGEWFIQAKDKDVAENCVVQELSFQNDMIQCKMPTDIPPDTGCNMELIRKFIEHMRK